MTIPSYLFASAAETLRTRGRSTTPTIQRLLSAIGYDEPESKRSGSLLDEKLLGNRIALLILASKFERIFQLHAPDAPGFAFFGGELRPESLSPGYFGTPSVSVSGKGTSLREAFEGCVGEAAEYVSQLECEDDVVPKVDARQAVALLDDGSHLFVESLLAEAATPIDVDWVRASRLSDGSQVLFPADLCLRRPEFRRRISPPFLLGTGTAAGSTYDAAILHAVLELVERDALGLWWKGGRRGRALNLDSDGRQSAHDLMNRLRNGYSPRETWLLDITTDVGVPCVVAVSCDSDGANFAFGAAAKLSRQAALRSALLEMCQMELAYAIVAAKRREGGDVALNERDRDHLRRAHSINAKTCELLQPLPAVKFEQPAPSSLGSLTLRLANLGVEIYACDITRPAWNIPAVRVVAPALQLEPSNLVSERLRSAILETGGGDKFTQGTPLL